MSTINIFLLGNRSVEGINRPRKGIVRNWKIRPTNGMFMQQRWQFAKTLPFCTLDLISVWLRLDAGLDADIGFALAIGAARAAVEAPRSPVFLRGMSPWSLGVEKSRLIDAL